MSQTGMSAEDRLDVFDLFARYAWAYDGGDAEAYAATFAPDGVLADDKSLRAVGRLAIVRAIKVYFDLRGADRWQHYNDHLRMQGDGERCTVFSYWLVIERRAADGQSGVLSSGWYESHCRKLDGVWRFAERIIRYEPPGAWPSPLSAGPH